MTRKAKVFSIVLDRVGDVYDSGSTVSGSVLLDTTASPVYYTHISVNLSGKAQFRKTLSPYHYTDNFDVVYLTVWKRSSTSTIINEGEYSFPFRFEIPPTTPSSLEGNWGYIRYTLHARIWTDKISNPGLIHVPILHTELSGINIRQLVSINDPALLQPHLEEVGSQSQPIRVVVSLPRTLYCIGDILTLHVSVRNESKLRINLSASLRQKVSCITDEGKNGSSKKTIFTIESDKIAAHTNHDWDPAIKIPPTAIIGEGSSCGMIQVSYSLRVEAILPRGRHNIKVKIPLKLGHTTQQQLPTEPAGSNFAAAAAAAAIRVEETAANASNRSGASKRSRGRQPKHKVNGQRRQPRKSSAPRRTGLGAQSDSEVYSARRRSPRPKSSEYEFQPRRHSPQPQASPSSPRTSLLHSNGSSDHLHTGDAKGQRNETTLHVSRPIRSTSPFLELPLQASRSRSQSYSPLPPAVGGTPQYNNAGTVPLVPRTDLPPLYSEPTTPPRSNLRNAPPPSYEEAIASHPTHL